MEETNHPVIEKLTRYAIFYDRLSSSTISFMTMGVGSIGNMDAAVFSSMRGTLESIKEILLTGHINDAYALLRKFYDAAIINIYTNLYLDDNFSAENFIVEKIENWRTGKEKLPEVREINSYIQNSERVRKIHQLIRKDKRYSQLRDRCNNHTHYNFYYYLFLNDNHVYLPARIRHLDQLSEDLDNLVIFHLSYLFYMNDHYMMSSDYIDSLDFGETPEPGSQYFVAPFIQDIFDTLIKVKRIDIATEIINTTSMDLE